MTPVVTTFVDEVVDETLGISSKRWALILVALVAGAAIAVWLTRRASPAESAIGGPEVDTI